MIKNRITALLTAAVMAIGSLFLCSCTSSDTEAVKSDVGEPVPFVLLGEQQEGRKNIYVIVKLHCSGGSTICAMRVSYLQ